MKPCAEDHLTCMCSPHGLDPDENCAIHGIFPYNRCPSCYSFRAINKACKKCLCTCGIEDYLLELQTSWCGPDDSQFCLVSPKLYKELIK